MSSTRDDILNNPSKDTKKWSENNDNEDNNYQKGTKEAVVQPAQDTEQKSFTEVSKDNPQVQKVPEEEAYENVINKSEQQEKKTLSYSELYELLNPEPDEEQQKKKENRARANNAIAALGDGISALANLHYTAKGAPSMYDGKNTLTAKSQARYDKLVKDYKDNLEKYRQGQLKARQLDDEHNERERQWQRVLKIDGYKEERDKVADNHWQSDYDYRKGRDNTNDEFRKQQAEQNQENWNKTFELQQQTQKDNKELRERQIEAQNKRTEAARAKGVRGKETVFSDGSGNNVVIYDNVWKGSKQSIINALIEDSQFQDNLLLRKISRGAATNNEIDNFINQNWYKSDKAKTIMLALSQLDPATMTSEINGEDSNIIDYTPGGNNDEIIDYVPKNN